jgi:hypothetical protein
MPVPEWTDAEVNAALARVEAVRARTGPDFSELAEFGCRPASFVVYMTNLTKQDARRITDESNEDIFRPRGSRGCSSGLRLHRRRDG